MGCRVGRTPALVIVVSLIAVACSPSSQAAKEGSTRATWSTSTAAQAESTTTAPSSTTTSRGLFEDVRELRAPTEVLDSYDFALSITEEGSDAPNLELRGSFVAPDALTCRFRSPGTVGSYIGTATAIDDSYWWEDGLALPAGVPRSGDSAHEDLALCPGAPEFWQEPKFLAEDFTWETTGAGDDVNGYRTTVLEATSEKFEVASAMMWVADAGWPIRLALDLVGNGGAFTFFDADGDPTATDKDPIHFSVDLEISAPDGPQIVRSPDGTIRVGPHTKPVPTAPDLPAVIGNLKGAANIAFGTDCNQVPTDILLGRELEDLALNTVQTRVTDGNLTQYFPGMAWGGLGELIETEATEETGLVLANMLFNHRAPLAALVDWTGVLPPDWSSNGALSIGIVERFTGQPWFATWDGYTVTYSDGTTEDVPYHGYLAAPPDNLSVSSQMASEAHEYLADWIALVGDITAKLRSGDVQAAADLRGLVVHLDLTRRVACVALADAFAKAAALYGTGTAESVRALLDEVAVQHVLLTIEYVDMLTDYLKNPAIDWLLGDDLSLTTTFSSDSTTGTVLYFVNDLIAEAIFLTDPANY